MNIVVRRLNSAWRLILIHGVAARVGHVLVNEFPKSGGSWVAQMLARSLGLPFPRNRIPGLSPAILHGHYLSTGGVRRPVVVWRDGRDVMLSWYFHCLFENDRDNAALVKIVRRALRFSDCHNVTRNLPVFLEYAFTQARHPVFSWAEFVRRWHRDEGPVFVKYEDLRVNAVPELQRLTLSLTGKPLAAAEAETIVADFSFETLSGRSPGEEKRGSFLRKGVVGEWRETFSHEARSVFHHFAGQELIALGYEANNQWVGSNGAPRTFAGTSDA